MPNKKIKCDGKKPPRLICGVTCIRLIMSIVTLREIKPIEASSKIIEEWGERLVSCYEFVVTFNEDDYKFIWVMATSNKDSQIPEYGDDFDEFLITICEGDSFKKCKHFINDVQERFAMALHYIHTGDSSIAIDLPISIMR